MIGPFRAALRKVIDVKWLQKIPDNNIYLIKTLRILFWNLPKWQNFPFDVNAIEILQHFFAENLSLLLYISATLNSPDFKDYEWHTCLTMFKYKYNHNAYLRIFSLSFMIANINIVSLHYVFFSTSDTKISELRRLLGDVQSYNRNGPELIIWLFLW